MPLLDGRNVDASDDVVRNPRSPLLCCGSEDGIGALHDLHVKVGNVALAIRQRHAYFELGVEHHVIFPKTALSVVDAEDAFPHLHLVGRAAPADGVVFALLAA